MAKIVFATEALFVLTLLYYNDRIYLAISLIILNNLVYYISKIIKIGAIVYRLGLMIFNHARRVRLPLALLVKCIIL